MREHIRVVNNCLEKVALTLTSVFLGIMTIDVFLEVVARYCFWYSFIWSGDVALFCFEWVTFLGGAVAFRRGEHFAVDLFPSLNEYSLTGRIRRITITLSVLIFALFLTVYGVQFSVASMARRSYALGIPIVHETTAIPTGGLLMLLFTIERALSSLGGDRI